MVLAAGFSVRLGTPKALVCVHGVSLIQRTIGILTPLVRSKILVIVPRDAARYSTGISRGTASFAVNHHRAMGLSSSVRLGIVRARYCAAVLLLPVDLAELKRKDVARLIARWRGGRRKVVAHRVREGAAAPLILPRWLFTRTLQMALGPGPGADRGLREFVRRLPDDYVRLMRLPSAELDVDTPLDLERARRRIRA